MTSRTMAFAYPTITEIKPDTTGFYRIDHDAYHQGPGVSSSDIKNALISYGHFRAKKDGLDDDDTPALRFGRAFHMAVLEPELFAAKWVVAPRWDRRTKIGKAAAEAWYLEHVGKETLTSDDMDQIYAMARALGNHPKWSDLASYIPEVMIIRRDPETGLQLKCKADLFGGAIVDVKTTVCAAPMEFARSVLNFGYHISTAFYQDLVFAETGERLPFIHVAVEKKAPFGVAFYELSPEYLAEGRKLWRAGATRIAEWTAKAAIGAVVAPYSTDIRVLHPKANVMYKTQDYLDSISEP